MSGIDEQYKPQMKKNLENLVDWKEVAREISERILKALRCCMIMRGPNPLNGLLKVLPDDDELVEYYENIKLNKELPVYE